MSLASHGVVEILDERIAAIAPLKRMSCEAIEFKQWRRETESFLIRIYRDDSRHVNDFKAISYDSYMYSAHRHDMSHQSYLKGLDEAFAVLSSIRAEVLKFGLKEKECFSSSNTALGTLEVIFDGFHNLSRQLRVRHSSRSTLEVEDEYDVQDLLHALLHLHFSDIRIEETCPSYAGSTSRQDFLLKNEKIVIEVKKTRKGLDAKKLGEELTLDKAKYRTHPDCKTLLCFVYDSEGRIANPRGIENDLSEESPEFTVKVFIKP